MALSLREQGAFFFMVFVSEATHVTNMSVSMITVQPNSALTTFDKKPISCKQQSTLIPVSPVDLSIAVFFIPNLQF